MRDNSENLSRDVIVKDEAISVLENLIKSKSSHYGIDCLGNVTGESYYENICGIRESISAIKDMQSAKIHVKEYSSWEHIEPLDISHNQYRCRECGYIRSVIKHIQLLPKYCEGCGREMR